MSYPASAASPAPAPAPPIDTPLARDFPAIAQLPRADLEQLLHGDASGSAFIPAAATAATAAGSTTSLGGQDAYFEALVQTLPQVRQMTDEHERLLAEIEEKARESQCVLC